MAMGRLAQAATVEGKVEGGELAVAVPPGPIRCPNIEGYSVTYDVASSICIAQPDSVWIATQTGRLDLLTALLAVFGIMLGLAALYSLSYLHSRAEREARSAAEKEVKRELPFLVAETMREMDALRTSVDNAKSDAIAGAVDEESKENNGTK